MPQRVQDKDIDTTGRLFCRRRHRLTIRKVGELPVSAGRKNQTRCDHASMGEIHRQDVESTKRESSFDRHCAGAHVVERGFLFTEGVGKDAFEIGERAGGCVDGHVLLFEFAEPAEIVEAENMVRMRVGVNHRINAGDCLTQALRAEIRGCVDLKNRFPRAKNCRRAKPLVPRIGRRAYPALATDNRYAVRSARSQKCDIKISHCFI